MSNYIELLRSRLICLQEVPRKEKTHSICLAAVNINGLDLYHVPNFLRSQTVIYAAIYQNALALKYLDNTFLQENPELLKIAVSRKSESFRIINTNWPDLITTDLCMTAVRASGSNLRLIPDSQLTHELIVVAAQNDASALIGLRFLANPDICALIKSIAHNIPLKHLPDHFKTYSICYNQVSKQGRQLKYVPDQFLDENMVGAAVTSNEWAIEFVPVYFKHLACVTKITNNPQFPKELFSHIENGLQCA